jgi:peptide/nickel transport system substrate-binding protein
MGLMDRSSVLGSRGHTSVRRGLSVCLGAAALLLAACGSDNSGSSSNTTAGSTGTTAGGTATSGGGTATSAATSTSAAAAPTKGGSITVGLDAESSCYIPSLCSVSFGGGSVEASVLDYITVPATNDKGYNLSLATSLDPNADFTKWTAKFPAGIKYGDGTDFSAADVKKEFEQYILAPTSTAKGNVPNLASVDAPDATTAVFNLKASEAPFPTLLTQIPLFKPVDGLTKTSLPIGTGPFKMTSWTPNVEVKVERNTFYWNKDKSGTQLPYLDSITFKPITSPDTRLTSLQSGDIGVALVNDRVTQQQADDISDIKAVKISTNSGLGLFLDCTTPPTDDLRVRQALAYATDKKAILDSIGGGDVRNQYWVDSSPWYSKAAADATPTFDLAKAKDLLGQYINDPARSDKQAPGTPLSIEISYVNGAAAQQNIAQVAQQQWQAAGVQVSLKAKDVSTMITDAIKGAFQVNYFEWATPHPYSLLTHNYTPWPGNPSNYTHFNSDQIQQIIAKMAVAKTTDELNGYAKDANMVFAQGIPLIFITSTQVVWYNNPTKIGSLELMPGFQLPQWATVSAAK